MPALCPKRHDLLHLPPGGSAVRKVQVLLVLKDRKRLTVAWLS